MTLPQTLLSFVLMTSVTYADVATGPRMLFDFSDSEASRQWQTVNDGVMGGRSDGKFRINAEKHLEFFGKLSLANSGGFASIRSRNTPVNLKVGDTLVVKVRGDGREYTLNLYTPNRRMAFSYRVAFPTRNGEWTEVRVPLSKFVATSFGRVVKNSPLQPSEISGVGILLGDKKPGAFKLEIQSIAVLSAQTK